MLPGRGSGDRGSADEVDLGSQRGEEAAVRSQGPFDQSDGENARRPDARTSCRPEKLNARARGLQKKVTTLTRELAEALEQQTATSEVLQVISSSPGELEPVFQAMLENATRICEAKFGILWLLRGRWVPLRRACTTCRLLMPSSGSASRVRPGPGTALGRVAKTKQVIHIADVRAKRPTSNAIRCGLHR